MNAHKWTKKSDWPCGFVLGSKKLFEQFQHIDDHSLDLACLDMYKQLKIL